MSHIKLLLLLASLSCLSLHCKKESELDKLPPATAIGANTFGCLLNGKAWPMGVKGSHYWDVSYQNGILRITYAIKDDPFNIISKEHVSLRTEKIKGNGIYLVPFNDYTKDFFSVEFDDNSYFSADQINKLGFASIVINRLDSINHFLSGTFEFSLFNESGTSQVKVSSGRFDFNYP